MIYQLPIDRCMDLPTELSIYLPKYAIPLCQSTILSISSKTRVLSPQTTKNRPINLPTDISINLSTYTPRKIPKYLLIYESPPTYPSSTYQSIDLPAAPINLPISQSMHLSFSPPISLSIYISLSINVWI